MSDNRRLQAEIDRLKHLLALYDLCECGWERREHAGCDMSRAPGTFMVGCGGFRLHRPADPLETIVEASK